MSPEKKFTSISKIFPYADYSLGYKVKTPISYEFGTLNGKRAVQSYINGEIESTRTINKRVSASRFRIYKVGGQTLHSARRQRENCLESIVRDLFTAYGFKVSMKPKLGIYHPDMLLKKDELTIYMELKAYHGSYICGDVEISQAMKYCREVKDLKLDAQVGLITSGSLILLEDSFLNNSNRDPIHYVSEFYNKLIIPHSQLRSLDDKSQRDIYSHAVNKFKKNFKDGFPMINVKFLSRKQVQSFPSCLSLTQKYDVILINYNRLMSLLKLAKLSRSVHKLKVLKEKALENLIINGRILKF